MEARKLLAVNVFFDAGNVAVKDEYAGFVGSDSVQQSNNITLTNGIATAGRLRISDPAGAILDPAIVVAGMGAQIDSNTVEINATELINIELQGGNDTLTVDVGAADVIATPIVFDGGAGFDGLQVFGAPGTSVNTATYSPGPAINEGRLTYDADGDANNGVLMTIEFVNLEPVQDNVVATNLVVNGTNADNAISYIDGPGGGIFPVGTATGLVSLDGFETVEFASKTVLTLNGLDGDDTISLDYTGAIDPIGLTFIVGSGGIGRDLIDGSGNTTVIPLMLFGGTDDDTLIGGFGGDLLLGGIGNDALVDSRGNDYFDGGNNGQIPGAIPVDFPPVPPGLVLPPAVADPISATGGFDSVVVRGTGVNDVVSVVQGSPTGDAGAGYPLAVINSEGGGVIPTPSADVLATVASGGIPNAAASRSSIEDLRIEARAGNDQIAVAHADAYTDGASNVVTDAPTVGGFTTNAATPIAVDDSIVMQSGPAAGQASVITASAGGVITFAPPFTVAPAQGDTFAITTVANGVPQQMVRFDIRGNAPDASDRLVIQDLGLGDVILHRQSPSERTGRVTVAPAINTTTMTGFNGDISYSGIENVDVASLDPFTGGSGTDGSGRVVVFQADPFEANDAVPIATDIGDLATIHRNPTIDPGNFAAFFPPNADEDWYVFNATRPGTTEIELLFGAIGPLANGRAGLPGNGALVTGVYDAIGNLIAGGSGLTNADGTVIGQSLQFTATADTSYFIRVTGSPLLQTDASASPAINIYRLRLMDSQGGSAGPDGPASEALGPQIVDPNGPAQAIQIVDDPFYDLFTNTSADQVKTPTPPVHGLTINFRDPVSRTQIGVSPGSTLGALDPATALNPGNYSLIGQANGPIPIMDVSFATSSTLPTYTGTALPGVPGALNTTLTVNAGLAIPLDNGRIVGQTIQFRTGPPANVGQSRRIIAYEGGVLRFATPLPVPVADGSAFFITPTPSVVSPINRFAGTTVMAIPQGVTNTAGAFLGDLAIAAATPPNEPADFIGQAIQLTGGGAPLEGQVRTIVGRTAMGFILNTPFTAPVPVGTTFNIVGTPVTTPGVVEAPVAANTFGGLPTPAPAAIPAVPAPLAGPVLDPANGFYVGQSLTFTTGPNAGQSRVISAYTGTATPIFTFEIPFPSAPLPGNAFVIQPATPAPIGANVVMAPASTATIINTGPVAASGLSDVPGSYVGQLMRITAGPGPAIGETQLITGYDGAGTFILASPFSAAPVAPAAFVIEPVNQAAVTLRFAGPLPDDRYTLTVRDSIRDSAGNALDGEKNIAFPSGDGISGGDFVGQFAVDSGDEIGVWGGGSVYLDTNGNFRFDPDNADSANRDIVHTLGFTTDYIFAGNFADPGAGAADGFDKLAAYGRVGTFRWLIDFDNNGVPDETFAEPTDFNGTGIPVAGNFDGNVANGDEIGLFTGTQWVFDRDRNFLLSNDNRIDSTIIGYPIVGDFDGDGQEDLGTYDPVTNTFNLLLNPNLNGPLSNTPTVFRLGNGFPFIGVRDRPVAGDIDADGIDDIGLWVPDRFGVPPSEAAEWYLLVSGGASMIDRIQVVDGTPVINFVPEPFGNDLFAQFGDQLAIPLLGNFDPPAPGAAATASNPPADTSSDVDLTDTTAPTFDDPIDLPTTETSPEIDPTDATAPPADDPVALPPTETPSETDTTDTTPPTMGDPLDAPPTETLSDDDKTRTTAPPIETPVNLPPTVMSELGRVTVMEDDRITDIPLNGVFQDDDELTFTLAGNSNPELAIGSIEDSNLQLQTFQNANGTAELVIEARDSAGNVVHDTLMLNVVAENDAPMLVAPAQVVTMNEDQPTKQVDLSSWFMEPDGESLRFEVVHESEWSGLVKAVIDESILHLTPVADANGHDELMIRAYDASGLSATTAVRINVLPLNDPPVVASSLPNLQVGEDGQSIAVRFDSHFRDVDADSLSFAVDVGQEGEIVDSLLQDSVLSLTPKPDANGDVVVAVTATDPHGESASSTFTLTVLPQNDLPVALPATSIETWDDSEAIHVDLKTKFLDIDDSALQFEVISNTDPGLVQPLISGNQLTLEVSRGSSGTTSIGVQATDGSGGQASHSINVSVSRSNQPPRVSSPIREIRVQENADGRQLDLDTIFSDPDGDLLRYELTNSNASLVSPQLVDAALDLLFAAGQSGHAVIGVTATDPGGLVAKSELRIVVEPKNESEGSVTPVTEEPAEIDPGTDSTEDSSTSDPLEPPISNDTPDPVEATPRRPLSLRFFLAR